MLRVGLTGGIACGKSVVAAILREQGCAVIEADALAHQLIEPGQPAYEEVRREFGEQILLPDGRVDRTKLGAIAFGDPQKLRLLNSIVHPRVSQELDKWMAAEERAGTRVAVTVAALLIEAGYPPRLDRLVVVWCNPEQQMERLMARGLSRDQALHRLASQMPLEEKRRMADDEIDCSGTLEQTRAQVEKLAEKLKQLAAK